MMKRKTEYFFVTNAKFINKQGIKSGNCRKADVLSSIGLQAQSLQDTIQLSLRDLTRVITDQYITAYGDLLTMKYSGDLFNLLKGEAEALKKLAESSIVKQTEFLAFDITVQQQQL